MVHRGAQGNGGWRVLAQQGRTVLGIRLAGHATCPEDSPRLLARLAGLGRRWLAYPLRLLPAHFVIGLSMGGILSQACGSIFSRGCCSHVHPYHLPADPRLPYIRLLSRLQPWIAKGPSDWRDSEAERVHVCYPDYPTRALGELNDLLTEMRTALPQVSAPTLLIYSRDDGAILPEDGHADLIYNALGSAQKSLVWIEGSGHVITRDAARSVVFAHVSNFVDQIKSDQMEAA
jgi:carboxylesterase